MFQKFYFHVKGYILLDLCFGFSSYACILQETYQAICGNHAPPTETVFSRETVQSLSLCTKDCQMNLACHTFAYNRPTSECLLSRSEASGCEDLEAEAGTLIFRTEKSDLAGLAPDLYFPFSEIQNGKILGDIEATAHNNPALVDGVVGKAISFNGVDQWADLGTHECFGDVSECTNGYSMTIWLNVGEISVTSAYIMSSGGQTSSVITGGMTILTQNGKLYIGFMMRSAAKHWILDDVTIEAALWFHLGVTWHKDGGLTVYIDGEETATTNGESHDYAGATTSSVMHVGKNSRSNDKFGEFKMDEWLFWQIVLNSGEVQTVFNLYK